MTGKEYTGLMEGQERKLVEDVRKEVTNDFIGYLKNHYPPFNKEWLDGVAETYLEIRGSE